ncbi:unnamed protein product [Withania somnifera]
MRDNTNNNSTSFDRYLTIMMLILVIGMILFSVFIWMIFGKEKPQFQLVSLQVPKGLMITGTSMLGNWQVNVSMKNRNDDLDIKVYQGKVAILYASNLLAENNVDSFDVASHSSVFLFSNLTTFPGTLWDKWTLSEANETINNDGVLKFTVQIHMGYEYTSKTESKKERIRVFCNDVQVQFGHGPKDKGDLMKAEDVDCIGNTL